MTDQERLAIAEEIIGWTADFLLPKFLGDMEFCKSLNGDGKVMAYTNCVNCSRRCLGEYPSLIDAVFGARQKLAAERNANKSPREKRLEEACARILRILEPSSPAGRLRDYLDDARKALKED